MSSCFIQPVTSVQVALRANHLRASMQVLISDSHSMASLGQYLLFLSAICALHVQVDAQLPPPSVSSLNPHPRLRLLPDGLAKIKGLVSQDPIAKAMFEDLKTYGDSVLNTSAIDCTPNAELLLGVSVAFFGACADLLRICRHVRY